MKAAIFLTLFASCCTASPIAEQNGLEKRALPVLLGVAKSFGALSATSLTNSGGTAVTAVGGVGNVGVWPGTAITGFPPGTASGAIAAGTILAQNGKAACLTAYNKFVSSFLSAKRQLLT